MNVYYDPEKYEKAELVLKEALALEASDAPKFLWWLSFCDPLIAAGIPEEKQVPGGPSFLGVIIADGVSGIGALARCTGLGLNPGGEVRIWGAYPLDSIDRKWWYRLLTAEEVEEMKEMEEMS